jgi:hypothetical protein
MCAPSPMRVVVLLLLLTSSARQQASAISPDPSSVAKLVGDAFFEQSAPPTKHGAHYICPVVNGRFCGMMQWGYVRHSPARVSRI